MTFFFAQTILIFGMFTTVATKFEFPDKPTTDSNKPSIGEDDDSSRDDQEVKRTFSINEIPDPIVQPFFNSSPTTDGDKLPWPQLSSLPFKGKCGSDQNDTATAVANKGTAR